MDLTILALLLFSSLLLATTKALDPCASSNPKSDHSDLSLIHIYGKCSPFNSPNPTSSWVNTVLNMASKDPERVAYLSSLVAQKPKSVPIGPGQQIVNVGNYVVRAKIGTPGQLMYMVLDTSNDAAWVPCSGCTGCSSTVFAPNTSSTFGSMDCSMPECSQVSGLTCPTTGTTSCLFNRTYSDSSFAATLSRDSLTLATDVIPNYAFGCINSVSGGSIPPQGLLGLGRGSMDLVLPTENSLIHSSAGSLACLAMAAAPSNVNSVLNVIANLQQQNLRILFDTVNSRVGIARELCN